MSPYAACEQRSTWNIASLTMTPDGQEENKKPDPSPQIAPYRWKPGQSGNPKGRPRHLTMSELVDKILRTEKVSVQLMDGAVQRTVTMSKKKAAALRLASMLLNGDMRAFEYFGDRMDPRAKNREVEDVRPRAINLPAGGPWGGRAKERTLEAPVVNVDASPAGTPPPDKIIDNPVDLR